MIDTITEYTFEDFPETWQQFSRPPNKVFCRGPWINPEATYLTIVGSRKPSRYGIEMCKKIIRDLADTNIVVVSGLAYGIDSIAHRSALEAGLTTIAFPGSGIKTDIIYPKKGQSLAEEIVRSGGSLISQFSVDASSKPWMFPLRNHLMAGLSGITLVIESTKKSGTLITAHAALEYGKIVSALPGPATSLLSEGTNDLIKNGAELVRCGNDIKELLGLEQSESHQLDLKLDLASDENSILYKLSIESCSFDQIQNHTGKSSENLLVLLSELEFKGLIQNDGGIFSRKI